MTTSIFKIYDACNTHSLQSANTLFFLYFFYLWKLGCRRDDLDRAMYGLEGKSPLLDGSPQQRLDPLIKCYNAAKSSGYSIFALQYGGQCFAGNTLAYKKYGHSKGCNADGRDGTWANEVYTEETQNKLGLKRLGCWKDNSQRTLIELEGKSSTLDGPPQQRTDPLLKCYMAATGRGFEIFFLQYGGQCFAGNGDSYKNLGKSNDCNPDGRGGTWANEVYKLNDELPVLPLTVQFKKLGCWQDKSDRALFGLEGKSPLLVGSPQQRLDPLLKCHQAAKANQYSIFSLQYGGQCFGGNGISYLKYGQSKDCNVDGRGGTWANEVYTEDVKQNLKDLKFKNLGCWKDTPVRTLVVLKGQSSFLDGSPQKRTDPLSKCYIAATERGFTIFALQYGGQCFAVDGDSYKLIGKSNDCNPDGRGGTWANQVYRL